MEWTFSLPVKIVFGSGKRRELGRYIDELGGRRGVLVCSKTLHENGTAQSVAEAAGGRLCAVFSDIRPNPTTDNVNACAELLRKVRADFAVALGGGSPMDCCKAACAIAKGHGKIESYHTGGRPLRAQEAIPMIAMPTTSGTASEVTNISVLTDTAKNVKAPMDDPAMYPRIAIVDPELTLSVPPAVTASTGLDVLAHALESYWSTLRQPICSANSVQAARLVFDWLEKAYEEPDNLEARENMALASILAGVGFSQPRTTGAHACSFPLTNRYGLPHGEACAFTLDYFLLFNARNADGDGLITGMARACGFSAPSVMAAKITHMKKAFGMHTNLRQIGCTTDAQIEQLTDESMSMLMKRNPVPLTRDDILAMYDSLR